MVVAEEEEIVVGGGAGGGGGGGEWRKAVADVHPGPPVPWPGVRPKKLLKKSKKLLKKNKYTTSR